MTAGSVSAPLILPLDRPDEKHKSLISSSTRLCLSSDSRDVEIFFTLDGSKPHSDSKRYSAPFVLPPGRVSVRATAQRVRDGAESATVTKVFTVSRDHSHDHSPPQSDGAESNTVTKVFTVSRDVRPPQPRLLLQRDTSCSETRTSCKDLTLKMKKMKTQLRPALSPDDSSFLKSLSLTEKNRIQRETDFLRCPVCLGPRPSDPTAVHCSLCGAGVDALTAAAPPAERAQMRSCFCCESLCPVSSKSCFVCDASFSDQRPLQGPLQRPLQRTLYGAPCGCGALNPASCPRCVLCDSALSDGAPCSCDLVVGHVKGCVTCRRCGASAPDSALFCAACGAPPTQSAAANQVAAVSHAPSGKAPPTAERSTQTAGLYFPSATALRTRPEQSLRRRSQRRSQSAVSPGRGFWRQQVDHVCAHLRSHAQNHAPFRTLLGEPRLGRLLSAAVREDPQELTLLLSFSTRQNLQEDLQEDLQENPQSRSDRAPPAGGSTIQSLSSVTEGFTSLQL